MGAETSISDVCAQREALTEVPSWKKFLMFDATTALAKARNDMLQRKASEERARVEAAMSEDAQPAKAKKVTESQPVEKSKRALKREKQKAKKKAEAEAAAKAEASERKAAKA